MGKKNNNKRNKSQSPPKSDLIKPTADENEILGWYNEINKTDKPINPTVDKMVKPEIKNIVKQMFKNDKQLVNETSNQNFKFPEIGIKEFLSHFTYIKLNEIQKLVAVYIKKTDPNYFGSNEERDIYIHIFFDTFRANTMKDFQLFTKKELVPLRNSYQINPKLYSSLISKSPSLLGYYLTDLYELCFNSNRDKTYDKRMCLYKHFVEIHRFYDKPVYKEDGSIKIVEHIEQTRKYLCNFILELVNEQKNHIMSFKFFVQIYYGILNLPYYNVFDPSDNEYHEATMRLYVIDFNKRIKEKNKKITEHQTNEAIKLDLKFMELCGFNNIVKFKKTSSLMNYFINWIHDIYNNYKNNYHKNNKMIDNTKIIRDQIDFFNEQPYFKEFINLIEKNLPELFILATFTNYIKVLNIINDADPLIDLQLSDSPLLFIALFSLRNKTIINALIKLYSIDNMLIHLILVNIIKVSIIDSRYEVPIYNLLKDPTLVEVFKNTIDLGELSTDFIAKKLISKIPEIVPYLKPTKTVVY